MIERFNEFAELESLLKSASNQTQPTRDLRADILDAALEKEHVHRSEKRLSRGIVSLFLLLCFGAAIGQSGHTSWFREVGENMDRNIYALSAQLAEEKGWYSEYSFAEAFWQTKRQIANRFRELDRPK